MDEERFEAEIADETGNGCMVESELDPDEATTTAATATRCGWGRWTVQFVIGAAVAGTLVLAFGKRAELSSAATLAQARHEMEIGQSFQAAQQLENIQKQNPGNREVKVALIEAYYRAGEPERARSLQNQVVFTAEEEKRIQPLVDKIDTTTSNLQAAADLIRDHQYSQAVPPLQQACKDLPDSPLPHAYLVRALAGLYFGSQKPADLQACVTEERRLESIDPKLAEQVKKPLGPIEVLPQVIEHTNAADADLKAGKTEAAIPELDAADRLYPNSAMVHALRAIVHAQRWDKTGAADEKRQALEEYRTAVQLNPSRASLRPRLGKLAQEAGD